MTADDVLEILGFLQAADIPAWVDGGWGVDALLGEQTREHNDLDIAVRAEDEASLRAVAGREGFAELSNELHNPVLTDSRGRQLDVHFVNLRVVRPGPKGWLVYGDISYDVGAFEGTATIAGRAVSCTTVVSQVRSHTGYAVDDDDIHDMLALHGQFGIDLPAEYSEHHASGSAKERPLGHRYS